MRVPANIVFLVVLTFLIFECPIQILFPVEGAFEGTFAFEVEAAKSIEHISKNSPKSSKIPDYTRCKGGNDSRVRSSACTGGVGTRIWALSYMRSRAEDNERIAVYFASTY